MKKITKVLALFALSSTLLVGCKNKDQSGDDSSSESGEVVKTEWTDDEKSLMSSHLHGIVLPFLSKEGLEVKWNEATAEEVGYISFSAKSGSLKETEDYSKLFKAADGWQGGDESESESYTDYYFQKFVSTSEGKRGVIVHFCLGSAENPAASGDFVLEAYDSFKYEWPADVAKVFTESFGSTSYAPAFPGALHYRSGTYYNFKYITCYLEEDPAEADAGYSAILEAQDPAWTVAAELDEDGYYVATSPDDKYELSYLYREDLGALRIYFQEKTYDAFPAAKLYEMLDYDGIVIPALTVEGAKYKIMDQRTADPSTGVLKGSIYVSIIGGTVDDLRNYDTILKTNHWDSEVEEPEEEGDNTWLYAYGTDGNKVMQAYAYADAESLTFAVVGPLTAPVEWGTGEGSISEAIADYLGDEVTDVLPPVNKNVFGIYDNLAYFDCVLLFCGTESYAEEVLASYGEFLISDPDGEGEGQPLFTKVTRPASGDWYISQNSQFAVQLVIYGSKYVEIDFYSVSEVPELAFPSSYVNNAIAEYATSDVVPAYSIEGDIEEFTYGEGYVLVSFAESAGVSVDEQIAAYAAGALTEAGYAFDEASGSYFTANKEVRISVSEYKGSLLIEYEEYVEPTATWNAENVAAMLTANGITSTIAIPELAGGSQYVVSNSKSQIIVTFGSADAATSAASAYQTSLLANENFADYREMGYGIVASDFTYTIYSVSVSGSNVIIQVYGLS